MEEKRILLQEWVIIFIVLSSIVALVVITKIKQQKLKARFSSVSCLLQQDR